MQLVTCPSGLATALCCVCIQAVLAATPIEDWTCTFTCKWHDLYTINGGSEGQALCLVQTDNSFFLGELPGLPLTWYAALCDLMCPLPCHTGTWREATGRCEFADASLSWVSAVGAAYECLCRDATVPLEWSASLSCASGTPAAINGSGIPPACRVKAGSSFYMGWLQASTGACIFADAAGGAHSVPGIGGAMNMQLLCKSGECVYHRAHAYRLHAYFCYCYCSDFLSLLRHRSLQRLHQYRAWNPPHLH